MIATLTRGANISLRDIVPAIDSLTLGIAWNVSALVQPVVDIDASAFLVTAGGRVRNDDDFVFYNQPDGPSGSISYQASDTSQSDRRSFQVCLSRIPAEISRLVIATTIHEGVERRQSFGSVSQMAIRLIANGTEIGRYDVETIGMDETALLLGELYRHASGWKFRAIGQGFRGGLGPLARSMGVEVDESSSSEAQSVTTTPIAPPGSAPVQTLKASSTSGSGCSRCGRSLGFFNRVLNSNRRCGQCRSEVSAGLQRFRQAFSDAAADNIVTDEEWNQLVAQLSRDRIPIAEALTYVQGDAVRTIERLLSFQAADGKFSAKEEQLLHVQILRFQLPRGRSQPFIDRANRLRALTQIREGNLPTVTLQRGMHLDAGEICHLNVAAHYVKETARGPQIVPGSLIATNRKLLFLSSTGGTEITWKSIIRIDAEARSIYLELSKRTGTGRYRVEDPPWVETILDALIRIAKRQLMMPNTGPSRHIPQHIKLAVWQRDGGKCTQCQSDQYLEFDHIIPFSQGGASSEGNIQLLCRRCNLEKGDRI